MKNLLGCILLCFFLSGCMKDKFSIPDVNGIDGSFNLYRMETALMSLDTNEIENGLEKLMLDHPSFMGIYMNNIMGFSDNENPNIQSQNVKGFIQDHNIQLLFQAEQIHYNDFSELSAKFEKAFQFYKYYFPEKNIPDIYTFISEYGYQRFIFSDEKGEDALGLGLDLFLGSEYPYQDLIPNNPAFSSYLIRSFDKVHIVKKSIDALVEDIMGEDQENNMLQKMVRNGKKLYIVDHILPFEPDSVITEYTEKQLNWCQENELEMWAYFLKEDLFYETSINKINKYVNPSPNSPGMPTEAPGRTGNYMGWKIVEAFMEKNPNTTLQELVELDDAQKILDISKYKPRK